MAKNRKTKSKVFDYVCPYDSSPLGIITMKYLSYNRIWSENAPLLCCPSCSKEFVGLRNVPHMTYVKLGGVRYLNLHKGEQAERKRPDKPKKEEKTNTNHEIMKSIKVRVCHPTYPDKCVCGTPLIKRNVYVLSIKGNEIKVPLYYCRNCGVYYAKYKTYIGRRRNFEVLNKDELRVIEEPFQKKRAQEQRLKQEQAQKKAERKAKEEAERQKRKQEEKERKEREEREWREQFRKERETAEQNRTAGRLQDNRIRAKDFVVKRTTFKCMHNAHTLQNIDAVVDVIDRHGNIRQVTVAAGYCGNCNIFFIMESAYDKLKMMGVPICRMTEEKVYLKGPTFMNGMKLAQESILMQYGYNVNQTEGLSSTQRKKILAVLIDNKILTKADIMSYLDFFINQRKNRNNMEKAIDKWEDDKEFVLEYNKGSYEKYGVKGIYRPY